MTRKRTKAPAPRSFARRGRQVALLVGIVAAGALGCASILAEPGAGPRPRAERASPARPTPRPRAALPAPRPSAPRAARPRPAGPTLHEAGVALVSTATPAERVKALRALERDDPAASVAQATRLSRDPARLVQLNALAVLARSDAPEAAQALADLDPEARRLARTLHTMTGK